MYDSKSFHLVFSDFSTDSVFLKLLGVLPPVAGYGGRRGLILCLCTAARLAHTNSRERVEYSECVHEPQHHSDDHHTLNIDLMRPAWDEAIHQKQQESDDDQRIKNVDERHARSLFCSCCWTLLAVGFDLLRGYRRALLANFCFLTPSA